MAWNLLRRKPNNVIIIGGESITVKPLNLEQALEFMFLLMPYIPLLESYWDRIKAGLADKSGERPGILSALFRELQGEMRQAPGDMIKLFAILIDKPPEDVGRQVSPQEFIDSIPVLDSVHNIQRLVESARALGISVGYK